MLQVITTEERGRSVITDSPFNNGQFVCEYAGELVDKKEAVKREKSYPKEKGSYMFFFEYNGKKLW